MKKIILLAMLFATITFGQSSFYLLFDDDREAPSAPTSPSAVGTAEAVAVSWTDPTALDCDSIRVYGGTSTAPTTWIASVPKGTQTYNWTGRTAQTLYYFRLKAKDLTGNLSDYTSTVSDTALNTLYAFDFDGSTEYLAKTTPELQLGNYSLNETFSDGDYTTGNVWTVSTGAYAVTDTISMYSGLTYSLRCATAGKISIPLNQAYGSWEFDLRKANTDNLLIVGFIGDRSTLDNNYYTNVLNSNEGCLLLRYTGGTLVGYNMLSANSYITWLIPYRIKITRNINGSFSTYIKGGSFGDTYILVSTTGGSGTNPVTDNTYAQSNYFVLDLDAGDAIANIQCQYGSGSLDLNGHELVKYPYQNSSFEGADTTYFGNNGTHSIDTSRVQKYAGSYSGKVIGTLGSELNSIPDWVNISYDSYSETNDSLVIDGVTNDYCRNDIITFSAGETYIISYLTQAITGTHVFRNNTDGTLIHTILSGANSFTHTFATAGKIRITCSSTGALTIENISFKKSSGDTTTNFISLASSNFTTLEAGKKYTVEAWRFNEFMNGDTTFYKLGSVTGYMVNTTAATWQKALVKNFQATSAEVNANFKMWHNRADTIFVDNFSITEAKDLMVNAWIYTNTIAGTQFYITKGGGNASTAGWALDRFVTTSRHEIYLSDGVTQSTLTYLNAFTTGVWQLATTIIDHTGNASTYINGNLISASAFTRGKITGTSPLAIGAYHTAGSFTNGQISEVQIATFSDISTLNYTPAQLYYRSKAGYYFPTSLTGGTVVGHWTWEGSDDATALTDKSGTGNTLTGTNITVTGDRVTVSGY